MTDNFIIDGRNTQKQIKDEINRLYTAFVVIKAII